VRRWFEQVFQEYGLPRVIRTDNGPPFASVGLGGLSALSVWWLRLSIRVERIAPGHPEQNGAHARMHRTLQEAMAQPIYASGVRGAGRGAESDPTDKSASGGPATRTKV
jgi:hypothetical protein